ncbi:MULTISPECIES: glutamate 5-kinase [unclassified Candidatus Frackibacter]|uniref:glutamate 5-kinase n=1 Tax=unclassified Candidatus Frackibacter TaxID=2648818 RepID=UPI000881672D|nr:MULTISPECIES: glutamate 5-kinase [unclassified Candidatus Frackibacter]SDC40266.1 glutamate 5-kinase [Candidatus Frackibacter sp. WG11]SEM60510.1 glutamate 5-kinase [Candidatus Frackibacter sp. WG12]SFL61471.1 glutamate 5-kinase [Candidatus Frackibacter sp. WG13]
MSIKEDLKEAKRIVIKIGSSTLTHETSKLNLGRIELLIRQIADLKNQDKEVLLVTSGAISAGRGKLGLEKSPQTIPEKQALAAVGQGLLMKIYEKIFGEYGQTLAQVLLTQSDITERKRYLNSRNALFKLLDYDIIPVINENDTVAVDEIKFGDNDTLSALVASLIDADLLVILSDVEGIYTGDPRQDEDAELIPEVHKIDDELEGLAKGAGTDRGTGGMVTKVRAAKISTKAGIPMVIANGSQDDILRLIAKGENPGTIFIPEQKELAARKKWIAFNLSVQGRVVVDEGAAKALLSQGKSLLACGIVDVIGDFKAGDVVDIMTQNEEHIGRGIVNYSFNEVDMIKGLQSTEIEAKLGYKDYDEVIHRDNLACF